MVLFHILEIIGTVAFAISGALKGINKELDYFGVIVLAATTAVGGGIVRDILIGHTPPIAITEPFFVLISVAAAMVTFAYYSKLEKFENIIQFFDAIGLGAFTAIGASIAIDNDFTSPFIVMILGLITGTGGGIIRDVFAKEIPFVFRKEIYATASLVGAFCYLLVRIYTSPDAALYIGFVTTFIVRIVSIKFNLNLKVANKSGEKSS